MLVFPPEFIWGAAASSYQIEGAAREGGKGPSIWDAFTSIPGKILNGETGDVACDHYHRFREDVALMAEMGLKAYRFSLSWPRIQPTGKGAANEEGLRFYSDLIDELLAHEIEPWITLYHWDLPLALQLEHDGWLGERTPAFFAEYARICFEAFGGRVSNWITFNEPWVTAILGHGQGHFAPGRVSSEEPYRVAHQMLLAHGHAVGIFRRHHQPSHGGWIGMANNCDWRIPASDDPLDVAAAQRALEFYLGWFADPLFLGDYPGSMRERVGDRLPQFTPEEKDLIHGSSDFFGLNHYTTSIVSHSEDHLAPPPPYVNAGIIEDQDIAFSHDPSWRTTTMGWSVVPDGCLEMLRWIDQRYGRPDIVITENGCASEDQLTDGCIDDRDRIDYLEGYISACHQAIEEGISLKAYFVWSLLDNFEWAQGYSQRFGLNYVDYDSLERTPKASAAWYRDLTARNALAQNGAVDIASLTVPRRKVGA